MAPVRTVCVYCGSGFGRDPAFRAAAEVLGTALARAGMRLVYGGGDVGLMGTVARAALAAGGHVTGIIPDFLQAREHMLAEVQETVVVPDMHTRKRLMFERSDAFVTLPGGIGTLEELVEQLTWAQLGRHRKPVVLVSVAEFWAPLLALFEHMRGHGFIREGLDLSYLVTREAAEVVPMLRETGHQPDPQAEDIVQQRM
ncbi:TIGR00730 family Rossman fold protein [Methylobacterium sp. J-026]|uniref:LOG family protein n=1 Tax=Methylobacterium sp. J-026 TaxID=2836624 RepID=UPI001FBAEB44|nr:TIGR00730 family Rossman fold protein [Methylobacterium sp. J-026]MCJ2132672.1 TIGR00730 family Rossman fold protein [Methylobacterium sp. J-026]